MSVCQLVHHIWSRLNYLNNYWFDYHSILYIHSCSPEDKSLWLWWFPDLSSCATVRLTFAVQSEISQQLWRGLLWSLLQIFMIPGGWIIMTWSSDFSFRTTSKVFTYSVRYLNIYRIDLHTMWYRYPWCPGDVFYWLWWSPDFSSCANMRFTFLLLLKYLNYWMNCCEIWYTHSWFPKDELL